MSRRALPLLLLLVLLPLTPAASAGWTARLDAPEAAPVGLPFLVTVCVEGAPPSAEAQARLVLPKGARTWQEGAPIPSGRYGPAFPLDAAGRGCVDVALQHPGPAAETRLDAHVRHAGGGPAKAGAHAAMGLVDAVAAPVPAQRTVLLLDAAGHPTLRIPTLEGHAHVPLLPGIAAMRVDSQEGAFPVPAPPRLRIVEARGAPLAGFVLQNEGPGAAHLGAYDLDDAPLPAATLEPGARVFLGERAAPDGTPHVPMRLKPTPGNVSLRLMGVEVDRFHAPRLAPGTLADAEGEVRKMGRTRVMPTSREAAGALVAYATPDAGAAPLLDLLAGARREVLVEGYTLTSPDVAAALLDAHQRGARVRVLLEGAPVGGIPPAQKALVGALARGGVEVAYLDGAEGFPARYASVHAKTIVVDRRAVLVATENLHESSYPAHAGAGSSRGFGLILHDAPLAETFAGVFEADAAPWPDVRSARAEPIQGSEDEAGPLPRAGLKAGPALRLEGRWNVTPLLSPEAGVAPVAELVAGARSRVDVAMLFAEPTFDAGPSPFLEALLEAARGGAAVRVLLDGRLDPERNGETVTLLREAAAREGLPLEARLASPTRTLHAKLVLVDGRWSGVGSMNWGEASATRNREAGLVVEEPALAAWLGGWYEKEWKETEGPGEGAREVPAPVAGPMVVLVALVVARLRGRPRPHPGPRRAWGRRGG